MAYILRTLILLMVLGVALTTLVAFKLLEINWGHIELALVSFIYTIFVQSFVMFYFIGVSRLVRNIYQILQSEQHLPELFEHPPTDLAPYLKKTAKFVQDTNLCKRKVIPWTMLMLLLGTLAFLLGAAHDTGMVDRTTHSGVVYGFIVAMLLGFAHQWHYLKVGHRTLRKVKTLYQIPDGQM